MMNYIKEHFISVIRKNKTTANTITNEQKGILDHLLNLSSIGCGSELYQL